MDYCNFCGKELDMLDKMEGIDLVKRIGYGSRYDLHDLKLKLCCNCMDSCLDILIEKCAINPLSEYDI